MRTGRPPTYENRLTVTTNIEKDLYFFGHDELEIPANRALTSGYIGTIDKELEVRKGISSKDLDRYLAIRNRVFRDLVLQQQKEEEVIDAVSSFAGEVHTKLELDSKQAELKAAEEKENRGLKLYVYDRGDDLCKIISREKYLNDPDSYEIRLKPEEDDS